MVDDGANSWRTSDAATKTRRRGHASFWHIGPSKSTLAGSIRTKGAKLVSRVGWFARPAKRTVRTPEPVGHRGRDASATPANCCRPHQFCGGASRQVACRVALTDPLARPPIANRSWSQGSHLSAVRCAACCWAGRRVV